MIFWLAFGAVLPPAVVALEMPLWAWVDWRFRRRRYGRREFIADWFALALSGSVFWFAYGEPAGTAGSLVSAAVAAIVWWIRRKPRRSLGLIGAKSRAARDALVDVMRRERVPAGSR